MCSLCFGCIHDDEDSHHTITFYNNSDRDVYVLGWDRKYLNESNMPIYRVWGDPWNHKVTSHSKNTEAFWDWDPYEQTLKQVETILVFVFDAELLETNKEYSEDAVLLRKDFSLEDLQRLNWTLSYPPTENMKTIMGISEK